jgi:hypothetical protein
LRLEVRQLPLFQHLDNVGHFPKLVRNASGHRGRNLSGGSGSQSRRNVDDRLGELVGVPRAFRVACHADFLSVDVQ